MPSHENDNNDDEADIILDGAGDHHDDDCMEENHKNNGVVPNPPDVGDGSNDSLHLATTIIEKAVAVGDTPSSSSLENKKKKEKEKSGGGGFMNAARSQALRPFVIISSSYLLFTITDGAIRMIVLQHAYSKSFTAMEVAVMFTLYELAGVFTNLAAGFMGARWGIRLTLVVGLALQLFSYSLLFGWKDDWSKGQAIAYVTMSQMFAGIAKDLTKLGGKTVTKLVTPEEQETRLFKLVSLITGWKNSLKGVGYFMGSALIQVSYELALGVMMALVVLAMPWAILGLDRSLGTAKVQECVMEGDFWFEVPLPFFLRSPSCEGLGEIPCGGGAGADALAAGVVEECAVGTICNNSGFCENINAGGGCGGLALERFVVGAFLGGYIILYGQVQSWTPQLVTGPLKQTPPNKLTEILWGLINCLPTLIMWIVMTWSPTFDENYYDTTGMTIWLVVAIVSFAIIFAINSSIHSFLVVKYASKDKVAVSVGIYYMSNALGRLFGTLGSGVLYTYVGEDFGAAVGHDAVAGLAACFLAGTISSLMAAIITIRIDDNKSGLKCGPCITIVAPETTEEEDDDDDEARMVPEEEGKPKNNNLDDTPTTASGGGGGSSKKNQTLHDNEESKIESI
eukprot:scaffold102_cov103-Cylindrotheca_fusiformis.AAC.5